MKIIIINIIALLTFGCATGNYDPAAGECVKAGLPIIKDLGTDAAYMYCKEKQYKADLQKQYDQKLKDDPEFAKSEKMRAQKLEQDKIDEKQKEEFIAKNRQRVMKAGSHINDFKKFYGAPDTEEIINGNTVLWYDDQTNPTYVVFKNDRLISIFLDRDTLEQRRNSYLRNQQVQAEERRHQETLDEARRARVQAAFQNMQTTNLQQTQQPYMMPTRKNTTTNCYKTNNTITCNSY